VAALQLAAKELPVTSSALLAPAAKIANDASAFFAM
jgi:hypothetical protein